MATYVCSSLWRKLRTNLHFLRQFSSRQSSVATSSSRVKALAIGACTFCATGGFFWMKCRPQIRRGGVFPLRTVNAIEVQRAADDYSNYPISDKEERFRAFASCEYNGQIYMTMQDFLESVTEENPRPRIGRFQLQDEKVKFMLNNTISKKKESTQLFRTIMDKGIISYTEYLFLLCILTKPKAGYEVAFKMFDRDGNKKIDRREFLLMEEIFRKKTESEKGNEFVSLLTKYRSTLDSGSGESSTGSGPTRELDMQVQETTLLRYFFGAKGTDTLDYATFCMFMDNLQAEVLELEFYEFSKGMPTISEAEFAHVLLRYTNMDEDKMKEFIQTVRERMPEEKGINFMNFKDFFQFLNNLDDFEIVLKMFAFADQPMNEAEFGRAVQVATGHILDPHVVHTVFQIFDKDGDGKLSQNEFLGVMKNRIHRGFRTEHLQKPVGWQGFKACVKQELKQK
ncbi:calcium uptake protein 3, mitochondrial-like isoform X3 [Acanthaster planci]|uniref:Calcium uptake protein 3, mitochondrial-like isoform X3 n=1 Tax=Acanthaster planci TaxID=133434 RepID=A0A8B7Y4E4_ACAPL|nr:calcium uptake protein 3, mitochondrial-like isoform X3 [Acanthaster planci]